jgi:hypothetical protein
MRVFHYSIIAALRLNWTGIGKALKISGFGLQNCAYLQGLILPYEFIYFPIYSCVETINTYYREKFHKAYDAVGKHPKNVAHRLSRSSFSKIDANSKKYYSAVSYNIDKINLIKAHRQKFRCDRHYLSQFM